MPEFSDCFGEIGTLKNTHHIEIKDNVNPVVTPLRKIHLALKPKLEKKLKRMVDLDIIEPVQKPTNWVNRLIVVEKPNRKLWVCLDPRTRSLNVNTSIFPMPKKTFPKCQGHLIFPIRHQFRLLAN